MKTHNAIAKRYKITKKGKVLRRKSGQDHFNSRESGNTTRKKRRDVEQHTSFTKNLKKLVQKQ